MFQDDLRPQVVIRMGCKGDHLVKKRLISFFLIVLSVSFLPGRFLAQDAARDKAFKGFREFVPLTGKKISFFLNQRGTIERLTFPLEPLVKDIEFVRIPD
jgi:hypothetical protein